MLIVPMVHAFEVGWFLLDLIAGLYVLSNGDTERTVASVMTRPA
jgi:hypothetical protein